MSKYFKMLLIGSLVFLNICKLSYADDNLKQTCEECMRKCKQYGSPELVGNLDTGRMRPPQRRRIMHQYLGTLQERMNAFPSTEIKKEAMQDIANRLALLKNKIQ